MSKTIRYILLIIVLILVVGAIYILQQKPATQVEPTDSIEVAEDPTVFEVGKPAPNFKLKDFDGNEFTLDDYKGKKVVLNLWASWCPFCIEEMPLFQEVYDEYKDEGLEIVAINRGESLEVAKNYAEQLNLTYPLLLNPQDDIAKKYNLRAMPSTYFIDTDGTLLEIKHGALTEEMFVEKLHDNFDFTMDTPEMEPAITLEDEFDETDGVKHSVPLEDIVGGGPAKDGIPSIDDPKFISVKEANFFVDDEGLGIAVEFDDVARFYPFQILVWHEIVNDTVGGQPTLITYCPLCGTGIVFEPLIDGAQVEFGTSGKLWNSNMVMYDRKTDSYWSQVIGEAIVGELTGKRLEVLPHDVLTYKDWKVLNMNGQVLSDQTGHSRDYSSSPYGDYATNETVIFDVSYEDDRYHPKEPTFTIEINGNVKIYPVSELGLTQSPFKDSLAGIELEINYNDNNTIEITRLDTGQKVVPSYGFWFSIIAIHPFAEVYEKQ